MGDGVVDLLQCAFGNEGVPAAGLAGLDDLRLAGEAVSLNVPLQGALNPAVLGAPGVEQSGAFAQLDCCLGDSSLPRPEVSIRDEALECLCGLAALALPGLACINSRRRQCAHVSIVLRRHQPFGCGTNKFSGNDPSQARIRRYWR